MRHNHRLLLVAVLTLIDIVLQNSKTASAQEGIKAADRPQSARDWDAETSGDVLTLRGHTNGVVSAAFYQGGERVVTGGADCTARVWDTRTGTQLIKIGNTGFNRCLASVSPDGSRILTSNTPYVKLWDAKTGAELLDLTQQVGLEREWPFSFFGAFSPDGKQIATCSPVFNLKLRETKTGEEVATLKGQGYWPNYSTFSPDGSRLITGCQTIDDAARVWDTKTGTELFALTGHGGSVWAMCFSPNGEKIATGGPNGKVRVWDSKTSTEILTFVAHEKVVTAISFSPDGSRILTGSQDRTARVWDAKTGAELFTLLGHTHLLNSAEFSPDGSLIVTASQDRTARIWAFRRFVDSIPPNSN